MVSQQMAIECPASPNAARCGCACHSGTITPESQKVKMACEDCSPRHGFADAGMTDVQVRALGPADLPQLCALLSQLSTVGDVSEESLRGFYRDVSESQRHVVAVIENPAGRLIGTATLLVEPKLLHGGSFVGHIEDVVVDQQYRGIGLGKLLVTHLVLKAHHAGCYKVILDCEDKNVGFYEKCGLEPHGNCMAVYF
ncbi:Glucose 6-phosphate N-acetyltransferase [Giardia muris]|uniref:Glucosamine 6-phosphate N-acetyltransferase n=1 Tax=Giardia muris TaxID=5742 RepID=A0A4Z1SNC2_GIAMU|nr:Glucose 6-phosphate N-acetyltransferase [Giardia muris]|eukprot:TNJ27236.1 Glucose 6-phosphate N-acetyltransferase [Giardia muris]